MLVLIRKTIFYCKNYPLKYVWRKITLFIVELFNVSRIFKRLKAFYYFQNFSLRLGSKIEISGLPKSIIVGKNNSFYSDCKFEFGHESEFITGDHVILSYGVLVSCRNSIKLGNDVQVGEFTSIRDTTHNYSGDPSLPMMRTPDISKPIVIGNNVWIGRSCLICEGSVIEDGVVVGAHSVVKGVLEKDGIYAGSPARLIKKRI